MPGSYDFFNNEVENFVKNTFPTTTKILDIGPGAGKYGKMFKQYYTIEAVEIFSPYIQEYDLNNIYSKVN